MSQKLPEKLEALPIAAELSHAPRRGFFWPWTLILLFAYLFVFLATTYSPQHRLYFSLLALSRQGISHGYLWQLITYQFMHGGWVHLILNGWFIFVFGRELEAALGARRFLFLVFCSGIIGGLFQLLTAILWPVFYGGAVVGASASAFGLVAAYAALFPDDVFDLVVIVFPVEVRAKMLLAIFVTVAIAGLVFPMGQIAHAAHLGGMATGWLYGKAIAGKLLVATANADSTFTGASSRR